MTKNADMQRAVSLNGGINPALTPQKGQCENERL